MIEATVTGLRAAGYRFRMHLLMRAGAVAIWDRCALVKHSLMLGCCSW
jgi:hypothetical protein